jgi:hypothetical protein
MFGPRFRQRLVEAGLAPLVIIRGDGTIDPIQELTPQQQETLYGLLEGYDPLTDPDDLVTMPERIGSVAGMAELTINGDMIEGVESSVNIGAAFPLDVNVFWFFFAQPQPDTKYLAFVQAPGCNVYVTIREADFFEITVTDRATGEPVAPTSLSISIQRVAYAR